MAKFNLYLRDSNAKSETPIVLFVYHQSRFKIPTGKTIHPKHWNKKSQTVKAGADSAKEINLFLEATKAEAVNCLHRLTNELKRSVTAKELREAIMESLHPEQAIKESSAIDSPKFMELFARFIKESETGERLSETGHRIKPMTVKNYKSTQTRLLEFGEKYKLDFDTINQTFYKKFVHFLNQMQFTPNTIGKHIKVIKTFMRFALDHGYTTNTDFQNKSFKVLSETGVSIYLTMDELKDLWSLDLSSDARLEPVRDLFLVGCFTGLRYGDLSMLNKSQIVDGFFKIKMAKTGGAVTIPVHPIVEAIMDKYDGFPKAISNQKTNQYLKEITALIPSLHHMVEIEQTEGGMKVTRKKQKWELVTSHTARRSFATNMYKSGLINTVDIMQITGHKTEQMFLKYIKVTRDEAAKRMKSVFENQRSEFLKVV